MAAQCEFRLGRMADAVAIAHLSRVQIEQGLSWRWTPARVLRELRNPDSVVICARLDQRLAGFAIMHFGWEEAHLLLLAADPAYRRIGVGRGLVEWLEKSARVAGIATVWLEVRAANNGAIAFYRRLGYRERQRLPGYYDGLEAAVRMARDVRIAG